MTQYFHEPSRLVPDTMVVQDGLTLILIGSGSGLTMNLLEGLGKYVHVYEGIQVRRYRG